MLSTAMPRPWPTVSLILNLLNAVSFAYDCDVHAFRNCGLFEMRNCVSDEITVYTDIWRGYILL